MLSSLGRPDLHKICVVLTGSKGENIEDVKDAGWVELRIDEFLRRNDEEALSGWIKEVKEKLDAKIIATVRWYREAGENPYYVQDKKRLEIIKNIVDYADFIDIELKSRILDDVISIARNRGKKVIISYHNFKKTPDIEKLKKIVKKGKRKGADIVKIATSVKREKHLFDLVEITHLYSEKVSLVVVPMGESSFMRFVPLFFGSLFTYVFLSSKVAPGQLSYFELKKIYDKIS